MIVDGVKYRTDMLDFPTAWDIQKNFDLPHNDKCSSVEGHHPLSGSHLLCDCGAVSAKWDQIVAADNDL